MRTLLMIMNPRRIAECVYSIRMLTGVDIAWISGYTETELVAVIADIVDTTDYGRYALISDDVVVSQQALDAVLETHALNPQGAVQGWVNMCATYPTTSGVMTEPLRVAQPTSQDDYTWLSIDAVKANAAPFRASFGGLVLHTMTRSLWQRFPFGCYGGGGAGWASDYHMCYRLQTASVPLIIDPRADIHHVKERWDCPDQDARKRLYLGAEHQMVRIQPCA